VLCWFVLPARLNIFEKDVKRLTARGTGLSMALVAEEFEEDEDDNAAAPF